MYDPQNGMKSWPVKEHGAKPINAGMWQNDLLIAEYDDDAYVFDVRNLNSGKIMVKQEKLSLRVSGFQPGGHFCGNGRRQWHAESYLCMEPDNGESGAFNGPTGFNR